MVKNKFITYYILVLFNMDNIFWLKAASLTLLVPGFLPLVWYFSFFHGRTDKETKKARLEYSSAFLAFASMMFAVLSEGFWNNWSFFKSVIGENNSYALGMVKNSFLISLASNFFFGIYNLILSILVYEKKK